MMHQSGVRRFDYLHLVVPEADAGVVVIAGGRMTRGALGGLLVIVLIIRVSQNRTAAGDHQRLPDLQTPLGSQVVSAREGRH